MSSCLGLFVQSNLIKYAKISKDHDTKKVDTFGVKFFDGDLSDAITQVVKETDSYKTPISINLTGETYNFFDMFALLNKKDLQKAIETEFDSYCNEKGYNSNIYETRYAIVPNADKKQQLKVIHVSANKIELNKKVQLLSDSKLTTITPISTAIMNLHNFGQKENAVIVNIEDNTTITTILKQKVYNVQTIKYGSQEILKKINSKENSYSKSYEVCKNTTIYTSDGKDFQQAEDSYLEDIMPTLNIIAEKVKKIVNDKNIKFDKVYITGTAALINNIDLYFQEYLEDVKCQILRPNFITKTRDITIKDYIEVNSAISLALVGLGEGLVSMNFRTQSLEDKMPDWMKTENGSKKHVKNGKIKNNLGEKLDKTEKKLVRVAYGLLILFIIYSGFSMILNNQIKNKKSEVDERLNNITSQIELAKADENKIKNRIGVYTNLTDSLQNINNKTSDRLKTRSAIPNLLNQIMFVIPENVQITSIKNTSSSHIEIYAQSDKYEQLGYLKAKIKQDNILKDVISTAGQKEGEAVTVKIEGELP